ncbi:MAG: hypothetical protein II119_02930 [Bacilli bacterium]|nr:hypothetical protein [Bacilli bacterium]MBQ6282877.1 hypothetical protein [Bacilli bacterium]
MNKKNSDFIIVMLVVAVIIMSIGFALTSYTQLLEINGSNVTVKSASWNVHFDSNSYNETTGSVVGTHNLNNTLFTYNVTLSPNEFYSAEFDVKNDGTFDAQLESIALTPTLSSEELEYLNYYIEYDGQVYSASQVFSNGPIIAAGATKHIKVYINYFTTVTNADSLPTEDHVLNLSIALNYKQV